MVRKDTNTTLQRGDLLHCPHCRQWHPLTGGDADSTLEHERAMLCFACRKGTYFAGNVGGQSRYPTRPGRGTSRPSPG